MEVSLTRGGRARASRPARWEGVIIKVRRVPRTLGAFVPLVSALVEMHDQGDVPYLHGRW